MWLISPQFDQYNYIKILFNWNFDPRNKNYHSKSVEPINAFTV